MNKFDSELSRAFDITSAWFKRYIEFAYNLKQQNLKKDQKYLYAKHHIIPKFWYKDNNVEINNSNDNLIVVTYKDHVLLHFMLADYFYNSTQDSISLRKSLYAIQMLLGQIIPSNLVSDSFISITNEEREKYAQQLQDYQYKINQTKKLYFFINDGNQVKMWDESKPIPDGWVRGKIIRRFKITNGVEEKWWGDKNNIPEGWRRSYIPHNAKGRICITNGQSFKMIYPTDDIPCGWHIGGVNKPNLGKISITNGLDTKMINKDSEIPNGWWVGQTKDTNRNKIHITNGCEGKYIGCNEPIPEGWYIGQYRKNKLIWINNGIEEKMIDAQLPIPDGWTRGTIKRMWITDGIDSKMIKCTKTIPIGWHLGHCIKTRK